MIKPNAAPAKLEQSGLSLYILEIEQIPMYWPELEHLLAASVRASSGMCTLEGIQKRLLSGIARGFIFFEKNKIELAVIIDIVQYDTYRSARIFAIGGRGVDRAMEWLPALEAWCIGAGCVEIEGWCNEVLMRFWRKRGMAKKVTMMTLDLRRKLQ